MHAKRVLVYLLIIGLLILILALTYFIYENSRAKGVCKLQNKTGICYINSSIQGLISCKSFRDLIKQNKKSSNKVIRDLHNLIEKIFKTSSLDPLPHYKKIFKECGKIDFSKSDGDCIAPLAYLIKQIMGELPSSNMFLNEKDFEKIKSSVATSSSITVEDFYIHVDESIGVSRIVEIIFTRGITSKINLPIIMFIRYNNFKHTDNFANYQFVCDPEVNIHGRKYKLRSVLVISKEINPITKSIGGHVFAIGERSKHWYILNDSKTEKIKEKEHNEVIFNNRSSYFGIYEME